MPKNNLFLYDIFNAEKLFPLVFYQDVFKISALLPPKLTDLTILVNERYIKIKIYLTYGLFPVWAICRLAVVSLTYHKQLHLGAHFWLRCQLALVPAGVLELHIFDLQRPAEAAAVAPLLTCRTPVGGAVSRRNGGGHRGRRNSP